jgi:hypothetical protein
MQTTGDQTMPTKKSAAEWRAELGSIRRERTEARRKAQHAEEQLTEARAKLHSLRQQVASAPARERAAFQNGSAHSLAAVYAGCRTAATRMFVSDLIMSAGRKPVDPPPEVKLLIDEFVRQLAGVLGPRSLKSLSRDLYSDDPDEIAERPPDGGRPSRA